jgi:hypothetical protein
MQRHLQQQQQQLRNALHAMPQHRYLPVVAVYGTNAAHFASKNTSISTQDIKVAAEGKELTTSRF